MLTDLELTLEFAQVGQPIQLCIADRHKIFYELTKIETTQVQIKQKIQMPNQLTVTIRDMSPGQHIKLTQMALGGLGLPFSIIEQICISVDTDNNERVMPIWYANGLVKIDLFASDFVQYHLLYNNKIDFIEIYDPN